MTVSRLELDSAERSYTYRTMEKLSEQFPMHRFFFIMGGDSLDYFEQWKQPERIAKLATILVIPRDLFTIAALDVDWQLLLCWIVPICPRLAPEKLCYAVQP